MDYKELMVYTCAMKEIRAKFEVLNTEFNVRYQRNPISTRLKKISSIEEKLNRQGDLFSAESIETHIQDVAGVRVICSYIDGINQIPDSLLAQDEITLIAGKNHIAKPKPNGYQSLHLIVIFADWKRGMVAEVQIRTIAQLKDCADVIAATDQKVLHSPDTALYGPHSGGRGCGVIRIAIKIMPDFNGDSYKLEHASLQMNI